MLVIEQKIKRKFSKTQRRKTGKEKHINTTIKARRKSTNKENDKTLYSSNGEYEEEGERVKTKTKKMCAIQEYQITQVMSMPHSNSLNLVTLTVREARKGKISFLLDIGATITFIKIGKLKGKTQMHKERMALTNAQLARNN